MNVFQSFKRALASKTPTPSVELGKLIAQAASERDAARHRLESLRNADAEVAFDDAAWKANGAAIADAERELLRFDHVVSELQERLADAQAAEAAARSQQRRQEAEAKAAKVAAELPRRLAELGKLAEALVRDIAEADADVVVANSSLPDGAEPVDLVEQRSRWVSGLPKIETDSRLFAWTFADATDPLPEQIAGAIEVDATDPNAGWWTDPSSIVDEARSRHRNVPQHPGTRRRVIRRHLRRVEVTEGAMPIIPQPLAEAIRVPGLLPGLPDGWSFEDRGYVEPADVLRRLDELERERRVAKPLAQERPSQITVRFEAVAPSPIGASE